MAFTIKGGKFSTDDRGNIRQPRVVEDPVEEVIDILTAPSRPAPVNVGMMPERRGDVTIPMQQSAYIPFDNIIQRDRTMGQTTDLNYQMDPKDNLGFVQSPYANLNAANFSDFMSGDVNPISTAPYTGIEQILARQAQAGQGDAYKDFFFEEGLREPSIFDSLQSLAQKALGYPEGMRGLYQMEQDKQVAMARDQELGDERRKDQERAERAAMLAAQQQQPVDPCPEGYRMDPVSRVCVPTDDTTEPVETTKRTYETMTEPVADYTAKTDFTVPTVTLPDILTYG
jgi:hypothetical protein